VFRGALGFHQKISRVTKFSPPALKKTNSVIYVDVARFLLNCVLCTSQRGSAILKQVTGGIGMEKWFWVLSLTQYIKEGNKTESYVCLSIPCDIFKVWKRIHWAGIARYSDWLRAGRSGDRISGGARFFAHVQSCPEAHPASCTMGTVSFPGVKRPGRGVDHPHDLAPRLTLWRRIFFFNISTPCV
jgi:hypothetical protein